MVRLLAFVSFLSCCPVLGQQILWERSWGHPTKEDRYFRGIRLQNGNYILQGRALKDQIQIDNRNYTPFNNQELDGVTGDTIRTKVFDQFTEGTSAFYHEDANGYLAAYGLRRDPANTLNNSFTLFKKDYLWVTNLYLNNFPMMQRSGGVLSTLDKGMIMAGEDGNWSTGQIQTYIYKFDSLGNLEWQQQYGELDSYNFTSSFEYTRDSCFIFSGVRRGQGIVRIFVHKIDINGNTKWRKEFDPVPAVPQTGVEGALIIVKEMPDKNYFMQAYIYYSTGPTQNATGKYDTTFTQKLWDIPLDSGLAFVYPLTDGGLLCSGTQPGIGPMVKRTDSLNHNVWKVTFSSDAYRVAVLTIFNGDSTALLAGYLRSAATAGQPDYWAAKVKGVGLPYNPTTSNMKKQNLEGVAPVAYPNPATDKLWFRGLKQKVRLQLTDMQGRKVLDKAVLPGEFVSVTSLPRGLYVWQMVEGAKLWSGKVMVER